MPWVHSPGLLNITVSIKYMPLLLVELFDQPKDKKLSVENILGLLIYPELSTALWFYFSTDLAVSVI